MNFYIRSLPLAVSLFLVIIKKVEFLMIIRIVNELQYRHVNPRFNK